MINNFYDFIENDIAAKKTMILTMPTKTKTNRKRLNENLDAIEAKYNEYRKSVRNYLTAKSRSFNIKADERNLEKLNEKITSLEHVKFLLNPSNTYFEKMGFDDLLYQIDNYYVFSFKSLDNIINAFLDKFELADIKLNSDDFKFTCYVHQYMTSFLEVRYKKTEGYNKVSDIFEQIYWVNPEIIEHIEVNFRQLIKKYSHRFSNYITKLQRKVMDETDIKSYIDCLEKLENSYIELQRINKETVPDIIKLALDGGIDINQYDETHKVRINAYNSLIEESVNRDDESSMKKIYAALEKLKTNIDEYNNYLEFIPLLNTFRSEYKKLIEKKEVKKDPKKVDDKKTEISGLRAVDEKISQKTDELEKLNRKIYGGRVKLFDFNGENGLKRLKIESVRQAKEIYDLYKERDEEYFKEKITAILNINLTIEDLLHLYYSFDYFKKLQIQKANNITDYNEIINYSDRFDLFAMDPTNMIVDGISVFEDSNIPKIISNKYRLSNLKVSEEDLMPENLEALRNKILLILRVHNIETSTTTIEKIWFMVNVNKIIKKEEKEAQIK